MRSYPRNLPQTNTYEAAAHAGTRYCGHPMMAWDTHVPTCWVPLFCDRQTCQYAFGRPRPAPRLDPLSVLFFIAMHDERHLWLTCAALLCGMAPRFVLVGPHFRVHLILGRFRYRRPPPPSPPRGRHCCRRHQTSAFKRRVQRLWYIAPENENTIHASLPPPSPPLSSPPRPCSFSPLPSGTR